ncbi:hypothetical protein LB505_008115 [Fusarium chuoi]|nr:hypothetical protein LB505_008115 [Fusarium chuoi]
MAKSARVVSGATVAPRTATVGRTMVTAVMDVRRHTVSVLEFPLMPSAVQEMARRVLALVLETAVLPTGSAGALQPTAGSSSACLTKDIPTLDGSCGSKVGLTCAGGPFNGQCCSVAGYCGTSTHCGSGW